MSKALVIVESPAKARTISKYLGDGYEVESSIGHVRDLPSTAAEIPKKLKNEPWARLGVNVAEDFKPVYIVPSSKAAQVKKLRAKLKGASALLLATDVDREGEAIAWHLKEVLKPRCEVKRMTFEEITKAAILHALENPREIDARLVSAQETRRILDRLYGYEVSPVLWRKVKPKLSAGRVQSVATRLVVARERERMRFVSAVYWDIDARLQVRDASQKVVDARLIELEGRTLAQGKDFDGNSGELKKPDRVVHLLEPEARALTAELEQTAFEVAKLVEKPLNLQPYPPFITSTLQQEAARKLRFSAQRTMRLAQSLYENGFITYMRTDSTQLSSQAVTAARDQVVELYGGEYLPDQPRTYRRRAKNAQEAHEAIRPAGEAFRTPMSLRSTLNTDEHRLYDLIWKRTVASQMKDAKGMRTTVHFRAGTGSFGTALFSASGKVITFPGFLRAYVEGSDDPKAELADQEKQIPRLHQGQELDALEIRPSGHKTKPPPRYTEASLIRELEERGIGRPSTYASILQTIQERGYVWCKGNTLISTFTAFAVINLLEKHLAELVDYDFTARMEEGLDAIASGRRDSIPWLREFYFGSTADSSTDHNKVTSTGLKALVHAGGQEIDARAVTCIPIGSDEHGENVAVRVGRYGAYVQVGDSDQRASVPDKTPPDELDLATALELVKQAAQGESVLGTDPASSKPIYCKTGRFGPYVQLGDPELNDKGKIKRGSKPKMASLWPGMTQETITLEDALLLLSFPREVGLHPETDQKITAQDGRFGPYLKMGDESRSLPDHEKMATITLEEAVEVLKQPKGASRRRQTSVLSELGKHPERDVLIQLKSGRYGPFVTDGEVNATLPKGKDPTQITLSEALELITAKAQKMLAEGKSKKGSKARKKTTSKKTTKKTRKKTETGA